MSTKLKLLICLIVALIIFGGGFSVGYHADRGNDPQDGITTVFTPYEDGISNYLSFLGRASKSVYLADYSFTDARIVDKLIELSSKSKVGIHLLLDLSQTRGRSGDHELQQIDRLRSSGIEVVLGTSEKAHQIMHHKYTVIDAEWVESGSWNYTQAANQQDNCLDFIKSKKRAKLFRDNWDKMYRFMKDQEGQASTR